MSLTSSKNIIIDTSVLLDDPQVIETVAENGNIVFLSGTIIDELNHNKKSEEELIKKNVRVILRELAKECAEIVEAPHKLRVRKGDTLTLMQFNGHPVYILHREFNQTRMDNDAKIIEIASDYGLSILTRDNGMQVRARMKGIDAQIWVNKQNVEPAPVTVEKNLTSVRDIEAFIAKQRALEANVTRPSLTDDGSTYSDSNLKLSTVQKIGAGVAIAGALVSSFMQWDK